jgi:hypothetical protein
MATIEHFIPDLQAAFVRTAEAVYIMRSADLQILWCAARRRTGEGLFVMIELMPPGAQPYVDIGTAGMRL